MGFTKIRTVFIKGVKFAIFELYSIYGLYLSRYPFLNDSHHLTGYQQNIKMLNKKF